MGLSSLTAGGLTPLGLSFPAAAAAAAALMCCPRSRLRRASCVAALATAACLIALPMAWGEGKMELVGDWGWWGIGVGWGSEEAQSRNPSEQNPCQEEATRRPG